jgi:hypothetical protein
MGGTECLSCQVGYECEEVGGLKTTSVRCTPQNEGISYYCPHSSAGTNWGKRVSCPDGTYSYQDRANTEGDCLDCPKGYYCPQVPTSSLEKIVQCPAGKYCMGRVYDTSPSSYDCPVGFYCPAGTNVPLPCDVGNYCATTGLSLPTGQCEAGYYCEMESIT